jgi:hypothetical protein
MTLQDAEKIVQDYGSVLAGESATDGPASYASRLPDSPGRIIQAMKLWLAHDIQNHSLIEDFRSTIETAASRLAYFVEDDEARRLNALRCGFSPAERAKLTPKDYIARLKAAGSPTNPTPRDTLSSQCPDSSCLGNRLRLELPRTARPQQQLW